MSPAPVPFRAAQPSAARGAGPCRRTLPTVAMEPEPEPEPDIEPEPEPKEEEPEERDGEEPAEAEGGKKKGKKKPKVIKLSEDDPSTWKREDALLEGHLRKGGGKSGTKTGKRSFFRLRTHLIVYYDKEIEEGLEYYKAKPKGAIPREIVLFAEPLDSARLKQHRVKNDSDHTLVVVCTSRLYRLVAETAEDCQAWAAAINEHVVGGGGELKQLKLAKLRASDALTALGKGLKMAKAVARTIQMARYLEDEVVENHQVAEVLQEVELPKAEGKASDLKASSLTKAAYDKQVQVMECFRANFEIDKMISMYGETGIEPHAPDPPPIQLAFMAEYNRCVDLLFKDDPMAREMRRAELDFSGGADGDEVDDEDIFESSLVYEDSMQIDHSLKGRGKKRVRLKLYDDHFAWHAETGKGVGKKPDGSASLRVILHVDTIQPKVLRLVHFDEKESRYCFFKTDVAMEKFIDEISHTILDYNKTDTTSIAGFYSEKEGQIREGMAECRRGAAKAKGVTAQMWQMVMLYLDDYADSLITRLKEKRLAGNERRLHIGTNNPHLATRRVASDLDASINTMSMLRASIQTAPMLTEHLAELEGRQNAAQRLMDMMTEDNLARFKDIDDMLENELAQEEDTDVEAMLMTGYGHDEGAAAAEEEESDDDVVSSDDD